MKKLIKTLTASSLLILSITLSISTSHSADNNFEAALGSLNETKVSAAMATTSAGNTMQINGVTENNTPYEINLTRANPSLLGESLSGEVAKAPNGQTLSYISVSKDAPLEIQEEANKAINSAPENNRPTIIDLAKDIPNRITRKIKHLDDKFAKGLAQLTESKKVHKRKKWELYLFTAFVGENLVKWYFIDTHLSFSTQTSLFAFSAVVLYVFNLHRGSFTIMDLGRISGEKIAKRLHSNNVSDHVMRKYKFSMKVFADAITTFSLTTGFFVLQGMDINPNPELLSNIGLIGSVSMLSSFFLNLTLAKWQAMTSAPITKETISKLFHGSKITKSILFPFLISATPWIPFTLDARMISMIGFGTLGVSGLVLALKGEQIINLIKTPNKFKRSGEVIRSAVKGLTTQAPMLQNILNRFNRKAPSNRCERILSGL